MTTRMYIAKFASNLINRGFGIYGALSQNKNKKDHPRVVELY